MDLSMKSLILILFTTLSFSQRTYQFDYFLEYQTNVVNVEEVEDRGLPQYKEYYLANSKNNDYFATISKQDSTTILSVFVTTTVFLRMC